MAQILDEMFGRRIDNHDGSFADVLLAPARPQPVVKAVDPAPAPLALARSRHAALAREHGVAFADSVLAQAADAATGELASVIAKAASGGDAGV